MTLTQFSNTTIGDEIKCLVVDDESIAREGLIEYINEISGFTVVGECASAIEATEFLKKNPVDLMFLDIQMPYLLGLDFLESLTIPPLTIITTAYSEYALDGYRLHIVDYLLKPISFKRFYQATEAVKAIVNLMSNNDIKQKSTKVFVRQNDNFIKIDWTEILYVESMQNYVRLHFDDRALTIYQTMTVMENTLPKDSFFRIHKSYLVNLTHVDQISANKLIIHGIELPISRTKKEELYDNVVYKKLISK